MWLDQNLACHLELHSATAKRTAASEQVLCMPSITHVLLLWKLAKARRYTRATSVPHARSAKLATVQSTTTTLPNSSTAGCRKELTILRALWRVWTGAMKSTSCLMELAASSMAFVAHF